MLPAPSPRSAPALDPDGPGTVLWAFASLVGQELGSGLAGWLRLRVSHEVAFKVSAGQPVIWRFDLGCRVSFHRGSLTRPQGGALCSLGPPILSVWLVHRAV